MSDAIVDDFLKDGWSSAPFEKLLSLLKHQRDQALPLALKIVEQIPKGGTFFDLLLSHLTEAEFKIVVEDAIRRMSSAQTDALESVIAYASLQFPELLRPHLASLFNLRPNQRAYYQAWPWRGADSEEVARLKGVMCSTNKGDDQFRAWRCLLESRRADCVTYAAETFPPELDLGEGFETYANLVGFDAQQKPPRALHTETCCHIIFPEGYFSKSDRPIWLAHTNHPTWSSSGGTGVDALFGGVCANRCGSCGGELHRMLRLDHAEALLKVRLPQIELCTCLSCLGWEQSELFFRHDEHGTPSSTLFSDVIREPEFPAEALQITSVSLVATPPRGQFQDWGLSNSRENLNRVGGSPCWIQNAQYPRCPKCHALMRFIMQLDSDLPTKDDGEWLWGSGGIAYFFWCDDCSISGSLWQCT